MSKYKYKGGNGRKERKKKLKREVIFIYSNNSLSIMQSVQDEVSS
jgi:hypothetical protein